ncbi:AAA family ATPase [Methylorubrum populi]
MPTMRKPSRLRAPFLKRMALMTEAIDDWSRYPFTIPALADRSFELEFDKRVTIFAGPNGIGKSSIIEVIADNCGFGTYGGSRNYRTGGDGLSQLSRHMRLSWLPRMSKGFYVRAETLFAFNEQVDRLAEASGPDFYDLYGGRSLTERSHGEAFLEIFRSKIGGEGIFVLDEPEAALSPRRQMDFLKIVKSLDESERAQVIIATHSPLIMAYPDADLFLIGAEGVSKTSFAETDHFKLLREFYLDPELFLDNLFCD